MKTTYSISINQTDDQGQPIGNLSMTTTDQTDLMRLLKNAGIGAEPEAEEQWSDDPADHGNCPVCNSKPCGCNEEVEEDYANEPKPEVVSRPGGNEFGEQRPQQDQRRVTARQGDNPIKKEDVDALAAKLEEQYLREWNTQVKEVAPAVAAIGRAAVGAVGALGRALPVLGRAAVGAVGSLGSSSDTSSDTDTVELGKYAAEKAVNPYAVGMAAAKKKFGYGDKPAKDLPKKVVSKGHEIAKKVMAKEDELDEFLDANVTVSGVKGDQSTSTSSKGGSSNVSGITSTGTGGDASGGAATGGNAGASNKAGANAKEAFDVGTQKTSQVGGNTTSNVSGVNITGQGGQGGNATATGGNAASSASAKNATQQGKDNKLAQEDQVEENQAPNIQQTGSGFTATAPAGKRLSTTMPTDRPLSPSDVRVKEDELTEKSVPTSALSYIKSAMSDPVVAKYAKDYLRVDSSSPDEKILANIQKFLEINPGYPNRLNSPMFNMVLKAKGVSPAAIAALTKAKNDFLNSDGAADSKVAQEDQVEEEPNEGNEFSGALAKAKAAGAKEFEVDGKTYQVKEGKKPDFLDIDKDGDKEEPMAKAAKEKEGKEEVKESSPEIEHLKALINWAPKGTQVKEVTEDMINQGTTGSSELDWLKAVVKYQLR